MLNSLCQRADEVRFRGYNNNAEKRYDDIKMLKRNLNLICAFFMIKWEIKASLIVMLFKHFCGILVAYFKF